MATAVHRLVRWYFLIPIAVVAVGLAIPVFYLAVRALGADAARTAELVFSLRNLQLLVNTLLLAAGVLVGSTALAAPLAWLTSRTDLPGRPIFTVLGVLPLAIPGYVLAYVLLGATGSYGTLSRILGFDVPSLRGYWGAVIALSVYLSPYLFLSLRGALLRMDASLEEVARSLGLTSAQVFRRVTLPNLRPAFFSGAILVILHVAGDFGVVSLMRYETFSLAIYLQFTAAFDRTYAAILALLLLGLTTVFLVAEARVLGHTLLYRPGSPQSRELSSLSLGRWKPVATVFCLVYAVTTIVLPAASLIAWSLNWASGTELLSPLLNAIEVSIAAALAATLLALPLAYVRVRHDSLLTRSVERLPYVGYALPPLALALAYVFFALGAFPVIYQTLALLVFAYTLHFLAEAIGPIRSALFQTSPSVEEAARSLGRTPLRAFLSTTLPLIRTGVVVSLAFVFLSALKELPLTIILAPPGFETLSTTVWGFANEAMFGRAAPYALAIVALSTLFVAVLLRYESAASGSRFVPHE